MRLVCDESVIRAYLVGLAEDFDVRRSVAEVGEGASDEELDEFARRSGRVVVTRDTSALERDADRGVVVFDSQSGMTTDQLVAAVGDIEAAYDEDADVREVLRAWV